MEHVSSRSARVALNALPSRSNGSKRYLNDACPCAALRQLQSAGVDSSAQLELLQLELLPLDADATKAALEYAATALAPPTDPTLFRHLTRGQRYWGFNTQKNKISFQIGNRVDRGYKAAMTEFIRACDSRPGAQDACIYAHSRALKALLVEVKRLEKMLESDGKEMKTAYIHGYVVDLEGETSEHVDNNLAFANDDFAACRAIVPSTTRPLEFTIGNVDEEGNLVLASARSLGTVYGASLGDAKAMGGRDYLPGGSFDFGADVDDLEAHAAAGPIRIFHTSNRNGAAHEMIILVFTGSEPVRRVTE